MNIYFNKETKKYEYNRFSKLKIAIFAIFLPGFPYLLLGHKNRFYCFLLFLLVFLGFYTYLSIESIQPMLTELLTDGGNIPNNEPPNILLSLCNLSIIPMTIWHICDSIRINNEDQINGIILLEKINL